MEYIIITICAIAVLTLAAVFLYLQNNIIDVTKYELKSNKFNKNIRIVH